MLNVSIHTVKMNRNELILRKYRSREGKLIVFEKSAHPDKFFFKENGSKELRDLSTINDVERFLLEMGCIKE